MGSVQEGESQPRSGRRRRRSRLRTSRLIFRTTSTSSGIGCRRAVIFRRRCDGSIYRKEMGEEERGRWVFPRSPTASPRRLSSDTWSRLVEPCFHQDSYGYRPGKSALDAVGVARQRCWRYDWVLDLDIQSFFDQIDSNLLMRAVRKHTDCPWVLLYIERWLKAPVQMADGSLVARERGTPQGGVISPILSNLFLHYTFDIWMQRNHPAHPVRALCRRCDLPLSQ